MKSALEQLREFRARLPEEVGDPDLPEPHDPLETGSPLEVREEISAVRFWSEALQREVWLAFDDKVAGELIAEFRGVPVLTTGDIAKLKDKPLELIRAVVGVMGVMPGVVH